MRISPFEGGAEIKKQALRYEHEKKKKRPTDDRWIDMVAGKFFFPIKFLK